MANTPIPTGANTIVGYSVTVPFSTEDAYTFSFPYLSRDDFEITVKGETVLDVADYEFSSDYLIRLTNVGVDKLNDLYGTEVDPVSFKIRRRTQLTSRLVDFQDSATLTEENLDLDSNQAFFLIQEIFDSSELGNTNLDPIDGRLDMKDAELINVAYPTLATSAATLQSVIDYANQIIKDDVLPIYTTGEDYKQFKLVMHQNDLYFAYTDVTNAEDRTGQPLNPADWVLIISNEQTAKIDAITNTGSGEIITAAERADLHTHTNKAILDATTASFTVADETKLDSITDLGSGEIMTDAERIKLGGIEANADVTSTARVDAAGAVMNSDSSTASMGFVSSDFTLSDNPTTKVPTAQAVKDYITNNASNEPDASETVKGIIEIADQTETNTGTDDTRAITPAKLAGSQLATDVGVNNGKVSADGSVTTHSDVTDAGSGEIITTAERLIVSRAVQKTDQATTNMQFVVDEDDMISNSAAKVPTQQSVKKYVDDSIANSGAGATQFTDAQFKVTDSASSGSELVFDLNGTAPSGPTTPVTIENILASNSLSTNINSLNASTFFGGQTFTVGAEDMTVNSVSFKMYRQAATTGNFSIGIYAVDGNFEPTGPELATTGSIDSAVLGTDQLSAPFHDFNLVSPVVLSANTTYILYFPTSTLTNSAYVIRDNPDSYAGGDFYLEIQGSLAWGALSGDSGFKVTGTTGGGAGTVTTTIVNNITDNRTITLPDADVDLGRLNGMEDNATADQNAAEVPFDNSVNGFTNNTVQTAIEEAKAAAGDGANKTLSNLTAPTAINEDLLPASGQNIWLGSSGAPFFRALVEAGVNMYDDAGNLKVLLNHDFSASNRLRVETFDTHHIQLKTGEQLNIAADKGIEIEELAATPSTPQANHLKLYFKPDHKLYILDDQGVETEIGTGAGGGATSLDELSDVDTTTTAPTNGDTLVYNGSNFVPQAPSGGTSPKIAIARTHPTNFNYNFSPPNTSWQRPPFVAIEGDSSFVTIIDGDDGLSGEDGDRLRLDAGLYKVTIPVMGVLNTGWVDLKLLDATGVAATAIDSVSSTLIKQVDECVFSGSTDGTFNETYSYSNIDFILDLSVQTDVEFLFRAEVSTGNIYFGQTTLLKLS